MLPIFIFAAAAATACPNLVVHDGDTIRCGAERVRISDIDAPELPGSPKCEGRRGPYAWCDYVKGFAARDALRQFMSRGQIAVVRQGYDKYGRTLALVRVNGRDAGQFLIARGLARPWY